MITYPPTIRRQRRIKTKKKGAPTPPPPLTGVRVLSVVSLHDGSGYRWTFDTPIVSAVSASGAGYQVIGYDPGDSADPGPNYRDMYYGFDDVGLAWAIVGEPTDITFADGLTIAPGQSGVTEG